MDLSNLFAFLANKLMMTVVRFFALGFLAGNVAVFVFYVMSEAKFLEDFENAVNSGNIQDRF